jgi:hypothetical protein
MRTHIDINQALRVYLGDESGGYQPIGDPDERLLRAYPRDHHAVRRAIEPYLREQERFTIDWNHHSLQRAAELFASTVRRRYPELDAISARGLASRFTFDWK